MSHLTTDGHRQVVVIFGPTASGKSALALALAAQLGGEIINADSRQVYAGVTALTAGPMPAEQAVVPHHLFDFLPVSETYSAVAWAAAAETVIQQCWARGALPIVVGGTGFYLRALMEGLNGVPTVPVAVTANYAAWPVVRLWTEVQWVDPVLAAVMTRKGEENNRQRLVRVLAVAEHTGTLLSAWQQQPGKPTLLAQWLKIGLNPSVDVLRERIAGRWPQLMAQGVLKEVQALQAAGYTETAPGLQALGVVGFMAHLRGEITLDEAVAQVVRRDQQYAKRQRTWLRNQYRAALECSDGAVAPVLAWLQPQLSR